MLKLGPLPNAEEMMRQTSIGLVLTMALAGCASPLPLIDRDASHLREAAAAARVRVFLAGARVPHRTQRMVPIEAYTCMLGDLIAAKEDALRQLRSKADSIGGNAVVDVSFETRGAETLGSDCSQTITASGTVARLGR
jgi:uncharacterized protein YbjQ (UPF0145 family)